MVSRVLDRPAEFYLQIADTGPSARVGMMGVEVRLSGVSRQGRTAKQFHLALEKLVEVVVRFVTKSLPVDKTCQVFCVIMLDGDIETSPGSGQYSANIESEPQWVRLGQRDK